MGCMYMRQSEWKTTYPQVSKTFHQRVLTTLSQLPEQPVRRKNKKTMVAVITAMVLFASGTAAAAGILPWPQLLLQRFDAEPKVLEQMEQNGVLLAEPQIAQDKNVTVMLEGKAEDENMIYLLFRVNAPDYALDGDSLMNFEISWSDGKQRTFPSMSWGFVDEGSGAGPERELEIWMSKSDEEDYNDVTMQLEFVELAQGEPKAGPVHVLVQGSWAFAVPLHSQPAQMYELQQTVQMDGVAVQVARVALTPLSCVIWYNGTDVRQLEQQEGVNLDHLDDLPQLEPTAILYSDGTWLDLGYGYGGAEGFEQQGQLYIKKVILEKVLEVEQVQAIQLGGDDSVLVELK